MKKIIFAIMLVVGAFGAYAETSEITTSQYYVDTKLSEKQDAAPANNANSVMTYDSTSADGIGAKAIYNTSSAYETQKAALVTAGAANAAIQNAINMEFTCANPPKCTLWDMTAQTHLPAGYTELEYIESTGTQWINTGISGLNTGNWEIYVKWMLTGAPTADWSPVCNAHTTEDTNTYRIILNKQNSTRYLLNGNSKAGGGGVLSGVLSMNTIHEGYIYDGSVMVDNVRVSTPNKGGTISPGSSIKLFGYYDTNTAKIIGRLYASWAKKDGVYQYNLVPVRRDSDNIVGMYDTVRNIFLPNSIPDGDNFIAGPVASYLPQNQ